MPPNTGLGSILPNLVATISPQLIEGEKVARRMNTVFWVDDPNKNISAAINAGRAAATYLENLVAFLPSLIADIYTLDDRGFWYDDMDLINLWNLIRNDIAIAQTRVQLDLQGVVAVLDVNMEVVAIQQRAKVEQAIAGARDAILRDLGGSIRSVDVAVTQARELLRAELSGTERRLAAQVAGTVSAITGALEESAKKTRDAFGAVIPELKRFLDAAPEDIAARIYRYFTDEFFTRA